MDNKVAEKNLRFSLINTFEDVKETVRKQEGLSRAGLMLGLQELGSSLQGFIGAYFPVASNIIVVNRTPLRRIQETNPELLNPYIFHVLLHEYIHSLGFLDEQTTRNKTYDISKKQFGPRHPVTQLSTNITKFFPNLVYPMYGWFPQYETPTIELIPGFDRSDTTPYIM